MDASIEMKVQTLDDMLTRREYLINEFKNLGMYCGFDLTSSITFYEAREFFQYAEYFKTEVKEDDCKPEYREMCVTFSYKEHNFDCYLSKEEVEEYADKISFLPEDSNE